MHLWILKKKNFLFFFANYKGLNFDVVISKGQSYFPSIMHIAILPRKQKVSNGIYTVLCFDKYGKGIVVGCIESVTNPKGLNTKYRENSILNVNGLRSTTQYNNSFINPQEFLDKDIDIDKLLVHLKESVNLSLYYLGYLEYYQSEKETTILEDNDDEEYDPLTQPNTRDRILKGIILRKGQRKFRNGLLLIYNNKCAICGCEIIDLLEAAYITPYNGSKTNNIQNGIILRTDLHTLFDLGLLTINANTYRVIVHQKLKGTEYYTSFHNKPIYLPINKKEFPSRNSLKYHNEEIFQKEYYI